MSAFQIVVLIWLTIITATNLVLWKIVYTLAKQELKRDDARGRLRDALDVQDPKSNPFLRAGLQTIAESKKKGSQNG